MKKIRILFVVNELAQFYEFKKLINNPLFKEKFNSYIFFDKYEVKLATKLAEQIRDCNVVNLNFPNLNENAFVIPEETILAPLTTKLPKPSKYKIPLRRSVGVIVRFFIRFITEKNRLQKKIKEVRHFLTSNQIDTIILGEENVLLDTFVFKKAGGVIPIVIYPYTIPNPKEMRSAAAFSTKYSYYKSILLKLILGPYCRVFGNRIEILLSISKILVFKFLGYSPKSPWILNSDLADLICIENNAMADHYKKLGIASSKLVITGSYNDDILAETIRNKENIKKSFNDKYGLQDKNIILVAFPPNQFPISTAEQKSYEEVIKTYVICLAPYLNKFNVIISKHPRIKNSLQEFLDAGFIIADEPTIQLVGISYLYIGCASATIRWAIACSIPVINYDLYRYKYEDYDSVSSVLNVDSIVGFKNTLDLLLNDKNKYLEFKNKQIKESKNWGLLDGNSTNRIIQVFQNKSSSLKTGGIS